MKTLATLSLALFCGSAAADVGGFTWEQKPDTVSPRLKPAQSFAATTPTNPYQDALRQSQVDLVHTKLGITGAGVKIGISADGVSVEHEALVNNYAGRLPDGSFDHNYAWLDSFGFPEPINDSLIGTHLTGVAVGATNHIGVAPGATFIACRSIDFFGDDSPESQLACLNFMLAPHDLNGQKPRPKLRPDVVYVPNSPFIARDSIQKLRDAGVVAITTVPIRNVANPVNCAGVSKSDSYTNIFTVGATQRIDGKVSVMDISPGGPIFDGSGTTMLPFIKPDAAAPAARYISSVYLDGQNLYLSASQPGIAGVHTVGIAALVISANPALKRRVREVEEILRHAADPTGLATLDCSSTQAVPNNRTGYGSINAYAAVQRALQFPYGGCPIKPVRPARCANASAAELAVARELPDEGLKTSHKRLHFVHRGALNLADFGDLASASGNQLSLCLYDSPNPLSGDTRPFLKHGFKIPFGSGAHGTWQREDANRWLFMADRQNRGNDGIRRVRINARTGTINITGSGQGLPLSRSAGIFPSTLFDVSPKVIAQLHSSETGACWNASFQQSDVTENSGVTFNASKTGH